MLSGNDPKFQHAQILPCNVFPSFAGDSLVGYCLLLPLHSAYIKMGKSPRSSTSKDSPKTRTRTRGKRCIEDGAGKDGPLKKSFEKTQDVGKAEQAWFVTYLKGTAAGKDEVASNKANDRRLQRWLLGCIHIHLDFTKTTGFWESTTT